MSKKILVLTPRLPYPLIGGDKIRIYSIAKGLIKAGHELSLVSFVTNRREAELSQRSEFTNIFSSVQTVVLPRWRSYLNTLRGLASKKPLQIFYYRSQEMASLVERELASSRYDAVLVHLIRMAPYVIDKRGVKKILEMTDALSLNYNRSRQYGSSSLLGIIYRIEEKRVMEYEQECIKQFDVSVVVSLIDRDYLIKNKDEKTREKVKVISHGVLDAFLQYDSQVYNKNLIVFIGNLKTHQNNDAILYFVKKIYPLIKLRRSTAILRIVGANPSRAVRNLDGKNGIEITGKVKNVADYTTEACVSVSPIRIGAGMRGKILESMAMGIPVVTTTVGVEGIENARHGKHFLAADTPEKFAEAVFNIMDNLSLRDSLSRNGKELARRYRYSALAQEYAKLLD